MSAINLNKYHDHVIMWLQRNFAWLRGVDDYAEISAPLQTPHALFAVRNWVPDELQPDNGQIALTLFCDVLVVVSQTHDNPQRLVRDAAVALHIGIQNSNFDTTVMPARVVDVDEDAFVPELDDYAVWRISFTQRAVVGPSTLPEEECRDGMAIAVNPEDEDNPDEYQSVTELMDVPECPEPDHAPAD